MPSRLHFHPGHMKGLLYKEKAQQNTGCLLVCWDITFFTAYCLTHLISSWIADPDFDKKICNGTIPCNMLSYEISGTCGTYREHIIRKNREASQMPSRKADVRISGCVLSAEETYIAQRERSIQGNFKKLAITQKCDQSLGDTTESYRRCWEMEITESSNTDVSIRARG